MGCSIFVGDGNHREQMAFNRLAKCFQIALRNIPERLTTVQRLGLADPQNHRFVWDLDLQEMFYWDGAWFLIGPGGAGVDELVKISGTDTTAAFLGAKLVAGAGISLLPQNVGFNETIQVNATGTGGVTGTYADGGVAVNELVSMQTGAAVPTVIPTSAGGNASLIAGFVTNVAAGVATVQYAGELGGFAGLSPHTEYFAAVGPGTILPTPPPGATIRRKVGLAKNSTTLVIRIDADYLIQA